MAVMQTAPAPQKAAIYWMATRSYSFPASIVSVLFGTALALRGYAAEGHTGSFHVVPFLLTLVGAVLAQAAGNVLNDYFDFTGGVDSKAEHGSGVLPQGLLTTKQMLAYGLVLLGAAALCGLGVVALAPSVLTVVVPLALIGAACALFYTGFLKKIALGDLVIMVAFGFGLPLGAYAVQVPLSTPAQWGTIALLSLPVALLVDAILHANNMRDVPQDKAAGVLTLAGAVGEKAARSLFAFLLFGPIVGVVLFVLLRFIPVSALAVLLVVPILVKAYKTGDVPFIAQSHLLFGLLYSIGVAAMPHP